MTPSGTPSFVDEFTGTTYDKTKWTSCFPNNKCTHEENNELQIYRESNIKVSDGSLKLIAKKESYGGYKYTSGLIQTHGKFSFKYGFVEARAKTPKGVGFWPTIWLLATDFQWPPELNVLEQIGGVPDTNFMGVHYGPTGDDKYVQQTYKGPDFTAGFHTYGMDWQPGKVNFFVDGTKRASYINQYNVPSKEMYLLLNLAVGGSATPPPNSQTPFPSAFEVSSIKVWT